MSLWQGLKGGLVLVSVAQPRRVHVSRACYCGLFPYQCADDTGGTAQSMVAPCLLCGSIWHSTTPNNGAALSSVSCSRGAQFYFDSIPAGVLCHALYHSIATLCRAPCAPLGSSAGEGCMSAPDWAYGAVRVELDCVLRGAVVNLDRTHCWQFAK
jgi:hypothetical protein